ncbi:hypothetical protein NIES37_69270 (plasmid) [Tolypothrix tenuis PCC 7101]|uniref:PLD phosphodiesterase domain-containing protein n=1 Tax=Tolypothrix tenuis PCC 7101 TaxID=231146 RepID=A0A1Z4NB11_9CYAN|nr:hypothetical protein [Aulosira sp. FACHB-113]BAZ02914.1 hypothetical protein NIES37_69270 [Tolypothrix tenuis PCC 7101]BAZ78163.1 hypothetical protein NIES50_67960 [Aulosira laxa NIES-50]
MFLTSSAKPIDQELRESVDKIERQSPSLSVLAARSFRYRVTQAVVQVTISESRKFNILEEFLLRAGIELQPPPTEDELAAILGLDSIFIRSTTANLQGLNILTAASNYQIQITAQGREFYNIGSLPQEPKTKEIFAIFDPLTENILFDYSPLSNLKIGNIPDLTEAININNIFNFSSVSIEELQQLVKNSNLGLHIPDEGNLVTSCGVVASEILYQKISIFIIFDSIENQIKLEARRGNKIIQDASSVLNRIVGESQVLLQSLFELTDEEIRYQCEEILRHKNVEVENRIENIRKQVRENALLASQKQQSSDSETKNFESGTAVQLRGSKISQELEKILDSANSQILIYSPWISRKVVNNEFIKRLQKLAEKGVWIIIGHGISKSEEAEERPIPPQVEEQLRAIRTREGLPAVQIFWLGGSHAKEVIVDQKVHLLGSNNLLSYRADWRLWDESVYKVTLPEQVKEAYEFYAKRFQAKAKQLWSQAIQNRDTTLATEAICLCGSLSLEESALKIIQQYSWLELYPIWLHMVSQGLRSKQISPSSAYFPVALSLLSQISSDAAYIESVREAWKKVIGRIAYLSQDTALKLVNDSWAEFTYLSITQQSIRSPAQFISKYIMARQ